MGKYVTAIKVVNEIPCPKSCTKVAVPVPPSTTTPSGWTVSNPSYAVDGDDSTYAEISSRASGNWNEYVVMDLGYSAVFFLRILFRHINYGWACFGTAIDVSNDGTNWTSVALYSCCRGLGCDSGLVKAFTIAPLRYIRWRFYGGSNDVHWSWSRLYELTAYEVSL